MKLYSVARAFCLTVIFACMLPLAEAGSLSGSSVTGELYFGTDFSRNWFYPPTAACGLNSASATVTVSGAETEFCYFLAGFLTVDLNDTNPAVTIVFNTLPLGTIPAVTLYLTDTAFQGLTLSNLTDSFPGGLTGTLQGDRMTFIWPGTVANFVAPCETSTCHSATFDLLATSVPEPSSMGIMAAFGLTLLALYRSRAKTVPAGARRCISL